MPTSHVTIKVDDAHVLRQLDSLVRTELVRELETGLHAIAELGAQLVGGRGPRRTGVLAAGWKPDVTKMGHISGGLGGGSIPQVISAEAVLPPKLFYGRIQDTGWQFHPQGLHFIEKTEHELEPIADRAVNEKVKRAIKKAGF